MLEILKFASDYGLPGIFIALLCLWIWTKDRQYVTKDQEHKKSIEELNAKLVAEAQLRVKDAQAYTDLALNLQEEVIKSVSTISQNSVGNYNLCTSVDNLIKTVEKSIESRKASQPPKRN
jgi:hypothetical protein